MEGIKYLNRSLLSPEMTGETKENVGTCHLTYEDMLKESLTNTCIKNMQWIDFNSKRCVVAHSFSD